MENKNTVGSKRFKIVAFSICAIWGLLKPTTSFLLFHFHVVLFLFGLSRLVHSIRNYSERLCNSTGLIWLNVAIDFISLICVALCYLSTRELVFFPIAGLFIKFIIGDFSDMSDLSKKREIARIEAIKKAERESWDE